MSVHQISIPVPIPTLFVTTPLALITAAADLDILEMKQYALVNIKLKERKILSRFPVDIA